MEIVASCFFQLGKKMKLSDCYPQGNQKFKTVVSTLPNHFYGLDLSGEGRNLLFFSFLQHQWLTYIGHHIRCRNPPTTPYFWNNSLHSNTPQNCTQCTPLTAGAVQKKLSLKELLITVYLCLEATFNYLFPWELQRKAIKCMRKPPSI